MAILWSEHQSFVLIYRLIATFDKFGCVTLIRVTVNNCVATESNGGTVCYYRYIVGSMDDINKRISQTPRVAGALAKLVRTAVPSPNHSVVKSIRYHKLLRYPNTYIIMYFCMFRNYYFNI